MTMPPVTFILTGYNQQHLIDAAVQGAFAQDYPDLQIILTDDRSSDGTFARMQAAAAGYAGPHRVLASRPATNQGTFGNIYDGFRHATGELIVFAGGDDVSYPHRTRAIVECWQRSRADAFYSRYDVIGEAGELLARDWKPESNGLWLLDYFPEQTIEPLHGASAACHRSVLERFPAEGTRIRSEDAYLTLMLALTGGRIEYIDQTLVQYRKHAGAITNEIPPAPNAAAVGAREQAQMGFAASQWQLLQLFRARAEEHQSLSRVRNCLSDDIALFGLRAHWDRSSFFDRIAALPAARRRGQLSWLVPRLVGYGPFVAAKAAALKRKAG